MQSDERDQLAARLRATFLSELEDLLRDAEQAVSQLTASPGDMEALSALFRVMHTLKGAGRAAGYPSIEASCHQFESLLADAREGRIVLGEAELGELSAGLDSLARAAERIRAEGSPEEAPEVAPAVQVPPTVGSSDPSVAIASDPAAQTVHLEPALAEPAPEPAPTTSSGTVRVDPSRLDALLAASTQLLVLGGRTEGQVGPLDEIARVANEAAGTWRRIRHDLVADREEIPQRIAARFQQLEGSLRALSTLATRTASDGRVIAGSLDSVTDEIGIGVRALRLRPFADIVEGLPRAMRALAVERGKEVRIEVTGDQVEADRTLLNEMRSALMHIVRNAIDHGIEAPAARERAGKPREGLIRIDASVIGDRLVVQVTDDGNGIDVAAVRAHLARRGLPVPAGDRELARAIFRSGVSTREGVDAISGRGVGLDAVREALTRARGIVEVSWVPRIGTTFRLDAPITLATVRGLLVSAGSTIVAIPTVYAERLVRVRLDDLPVVDGHPVVPTGGAPASIVSLNRLMGTAENADVDGLVPGVVLAVGDKRVVIVVDELLGEQELVVQPIRAGRGGGSPLASAAAILSSGRVAIVANVPALLAAAGNLEPVEHHRVAARDKTRRRARILVVDDSITTRTLEQSLLEAAGYEVYVGVDGADGWRLVQERSPDLVVADVEMPRMDGFALCEAIRRSARFRETPVILITALETPEHRERGLEAGADAYLGKSSFDQENLLDTVGQLLGRSGS